MKVTVIGGGSSYTPELADGLIDRAKDLDLYELCLQDVDEERLSTVAGFTRRMAEEKGPSLTITDTTDRDSAITGADFVITQVRVGGNEARKKDELLGMRHGLIGQETTGVGGFAKALRTIPVMLDLAGAMERLCPLSTLINFTNPSGLVTEAVIKHGSVKTVGLCNIPINFHFEIAKALGVGRDEVRYDYVGLNHLSWVTRIEVKGEDVTEKVLEWADSVGRPANLEDLEYPPALLKALRAIPMHYLRYYYMTDTMIEKQNKKDRTRAEEVMEIESELMKIYGDESSREKPEQLMKRGGAHYSLAAMELIESIHYARRDVQVLDVQNNGAVPGMPDDAVVEVPCQVGSDGPRPIPQETPAPELLGLMRVVKAYEELAVEAAVTKSREKALLALVTHPLGPDADKADEVLDDMIETHGIELG